MQILNQPSEPTTTTVATAIEDKRIWIAKSQNTFKSAGIFDYQWVEGVLQEGEIVASRPGARHVREVGPCASLQLDLKGGVQVVQTSDELAYWLYNKDVPIPLLPKCVSSRIHSPNRQKWKSGSMVKSPPVFVDGGWVKEKV